MNPQKPQSPIEYEKILRKTLKTILNKNSWHPCDILELKSVAQSINTHITYLMGEEFLNKLALPKDNFKYIDMCKNGYDIEVTSANGKQIVAEIKGNIPLGDIKYGATQKDGVIGNIKDLTEGKRKAITHKTKDSLKDVYRFLILLDNNRAAITNLIDNLCNRKKAPYDEEYFKIWEEDTQLDEKFLEKCEPDMINIVFISL